MNHRTCQHCGKLKPENYFICGRGFSPRCSTCRLGEEIQSRKSEAMRRAYQEMREDEETDNSAPAVRNVQKRRGGSIPDEIRKRLSWLTPVVHSMDRPDNLDLLAEILDFVNRRMA